jgi:hypothetical protein
MGDSGGKFYFSYCDYAKLGQKARHVQKGVNRTT